MKFCIYYVNHLFKFRLSLTVSEELGLDWLQYSMGNMLTGIKGLYIKNYLLNLVTSRALLHKTPPFKIVLHFPQTNSHCWTPHKALETNDIANQTRSFIFDILWSIEIRESLSKDRYQKHRKIYMKRFKRYNLI